MRGVNVFNQLALNPALLENLAFLGYASPTPVQAAAIPSALAGKDMIVTAETGSGKTAAFLLPLLERLLTEPAAVPRGLVLCPTREIALQVEGEARRLSRGTPVCSLAVYGGVGISSQLAGLKNGLDLVVATPGRLLDHIWRGSFNPDGLRFLVLDEADRMLDMGFLPDLRRIMDCLPTERQTMLFSATMPSEIAEIAVRFLREPDRITVGRPAVPPSGIEQQVYPVSQERKTEMLLHLLASAPTESVLVFARTKHRVDRLAGQLRRARIDAACLHGDRSQSQREVALNGFRRGFIKVLVATDIAARGLDIKAVSHVVNYDLPNCPEDYVHRIGRTARAGASGTAWSMMTAEDARILKAIERTVGHPLTRVTLPGFGQASAAPRMTVRGSGTRRHRSIRMVLGSTRGIDRGADPFAAQQELPTLRGRMEAGKTKFKKVRRIMMASKRLYVGNLSYQSSEQDVRDLFAAYDPGEVRIIPNKGFGFVDVPEEKAVEAIAATNGVDLGGRKIVVNEARPRGERTGGGFGGSDHGRGRGGYASGNRGPGRGRRFY